MTKEYIQPSDGEILKDFKCWSCGENSVEFFTHFSNLGNPEEILTDVFMCECGIFTYRESKVVKTTKEILDEQFTRVGNRLTLRKNFDVKYVPSSVSESFDNTHRVFLEKKYASFAPFFKDLLKLIFDKAYETYHNESSFPQPIEHAPKWLLSDKIITETMRNSLSVVLKLPGEIQKISPKEDSSIVLLGEIDRQCYFALELVEQVIRVIWETHGIVKCIKPTLIDEPKN